MISTIRHPSEILQFGIFEGASIKHFVSTRFGGTSTGKFSSLNLGFVEGEKPENVKANINILGNLIGIEPTSFTFGEQIHSGNVAVVSAKDGGGGSEVSGIPRMDGLITNSSGICLMVRVADCAPILVLDPVTNAIGIAHGGRMGVVNKIAVNLVRKLFEKFGSRPADLRAGIGPCISGGHYIISEAAAKQLTTALGSKTESLTNQGGRIQFDLATAHREQLIGAGVGSDNIELSNLCTFENDQLFYSERRDGAPTGRFVAGIMLI